MSTAHDATAPDARARFRMERKPKALRLEAEGEWTTKDADKLSSALRHIDIGDAATAEIDGTHLDRLDSAGAWLLVRTNLDRLEQVMNVGQIALDPLYDSLLHSVVHEH